MRNILNLIKKRRTIRKYKNKSVPPGVVEKIIEAAVWAPSAHNSQPWKFIIVTEKDVKLRLVQKIEKKISHSFLASVKIALNNSFKIIENAPLLVCAYNTRSLSTITKNLGGTYSKPSYISEVESVSAAIENMFLVATHFGLGGCWMTMPLLVEKEVNTFFNTRDNLVAILTFGYPAEKGQCRPRKPLSQIVQYIK